MFYGVGRMRTIIFFVLLAFVSCSKGPGEPGKNLEISSTKPGKFCFFGDGGTGSKGQQEVANLLVEEDCDIYFYLGDLIYPSGIKSSDDPQLKELFFGPYGPIIAKRPLVVMMGNHDYQGDMDAWVELAARNKNLIYPGHYFRLNYNHLCFLALNTTNDKFAQANWLSGLELESCQGVILLGHHPLKSSGKHAKPYFPLSIFLKYAASKADVFISGHDHHLSYEGKVGGTHQFVSGAAGQLRKLDESIPVWGKSQLGYLTYDVDRFLFTFWGLGKGGEKEKLFAQKIPLGALANQ